MRQCARLTTQRHTVLKILAIAAVLAGRRFAHWRLEQKPFSAVEEAQPFWSDTMTDDRIAGTAKNLGGKAQEAYGSVTGDYGAQAKGKLRQVEGTAQDLYGQAKDAVTDAARVAQEGAAEVRDVVRDIIEARPFTVAFGALAIGFLLGRMGRPD
jgi:uncharacterized protein YjbJ (UPF0337 family)